MRDGEIKAAGERIVRDVEKDAQSRAYRASNALRNASQFVLRGQRSGRRYRVPFTGSGAIRDSRRKPKYYNASSPGEPPANRTGLLRKSWQARPRSQDHGKVTTAYASIYSNVPYIKYLEPELSGRDPGNTVKPRPFVRKIQAKAMPGIKRIYGKRFK